MSTPKLPHSTSADRSTKPTSYSSQQPASWRRQPTPKTEPEGFPSEFSPTHHPVYIVLTPLIETKYSTSVFNTMVEGVIGYEICQMIGTCLNHRKYPVTHNLISYRDYHQSLLLHMHSHLGGIVHAFLYVVLSIVLNSY